MRHGSFRGGVVLQINLAPPDYALARYMLPHQIQFWYGQVDGVVLVMETKQSRGRFGGTDWNDNLAKLEELIDQLSKRYADIYTVSVDYAEQTKKRVANYWFGADDIPDKDFLGGPFYAYMYALYRYRDCFILHSDSDMIFGGNEERWIPDARRYIDDEGYFTASPIHGPPRPDWAVPRETIRRVGDSAYVLQKFSTRVFLLYPKRFEELGATLKLEREISLRHFLNSFEIGVSMWKQPEKLLTKFMREHGLERIDFFGRGRNSGVYTLHPKRKPAAYIQALPEILGRVARNDIPAAQRGHYNIQDCLFDYSPYRQGRRPLGAKLRAESALFSRMAKYYLGRIRGTQGANRE